MAFISDLKKDFKKLADGGKLSHAYLFFGQAPERGLTLAKEMANYLETGEWRAPEGVLIDAYFLLKESPGIDDSREMIKFLWQKPIKSSRRTLVVLKAEELTTHAQNGILKISEEPPESALIILIARSPESLIFPLQSRFQKIFISGEPKPEESSELKKIVSEILKAGGAKQKSEIIKKMLEDEVNLSEFIAVLLNSLRKDLIGNSGIIKEILHRWRMINQFNVNKKLQLEVAINSPNIRI